MQERVVVKLRRVHIYSPIQLLAVFVSIMVRFMIMQWSCGSIWNHPLVFKC